MYQLLWNNKPLRERVSLAFRFAERYVEWKINRSPKSTKKKLVYYKYTNSVCKIAFLVTGLFGHHHISLRALREYIVQYFFYSIPSKCKCSAVTSPPLRMACLFLRHRSSMFTGLSSNHPRLSAIKCLFLHPPHCISTTPFS